MASARYLTAAIACLLVTLVPAAEPVVLQRVELAESAGQAPEGAGDFYARPAALPTVWWARLPGQWEGARLWSAWGDAHWAANGKVYASIGDHGTPYGTTYLYELDPDSRELRQVVDVNALLGLTDKERYAPGKIHGPLIEPGDGWLYIATYRGSIRHSSAAIGYAGDWLLRYNLTTGATENLGIFVPHCSAVAMRYHAPSKTIYGLAVYGESMPDPQADLFFAYSLADKALQYTAPSPSKLNRALFLTADGTAWVDGPEGTLHRYRAGDAGLSATTVTLPEGEALRATSRPTRDGMLYGITQSGIIFAFDPATPAIEVLGKTVHAGKGYTAVMRLDPSERYLYYVPAAHGGSRAHGGVVARFDLQRRKPQAVAYFHTAIAKQFAYNLGGTYSLALSPDGRRLAILWNGGPVDTKRNDFGDCSMMLLELPTDPE